MRSGRRLLIIGSLAFLGGCQHAAPGPVLNERQTVVNPFAPASIRVHPLTHLEFGEDGESGAAMIVLHVELRDHWGESCKGVGSAVIELYRPTLGPGSGLEQQELVWEVDLYDLKRNAQLYDPATRTYRLQLANLPPWLRPGEGAERRIRVNVTLTAPDANGEQTILEDAYVLRF